ncbi:four-domain proteases inhibitor-like [Argopecten irradians]|uniref:four-domain proteases inhibitor-like n=1 Tax=Argopecten irradians TaxID=31199 RepID=UPI003712F119
MSLDCKTQVTEHYEVCGTDGVTYHNNCHFLQTSCVDTTLGLAHQGTCHLSTTPVGTNSSLTSIPTTGSTTMEGTTPSVSSLPSIAQIIHSVFCETKDSITCDHSLNLQCGSNGQVYPNECEFYKAACDDSALILTDSSKCAI